MNRENSNEGIMHVGIYAVFNKNGVTHRLYANPYGFWQPRKTKKNPQKETNEETPSRVCKHPEGIVMLASKTVPELKYQEKRPELLDLVNQLNKEEERGIDLENRIIAPDNFEKILNS